MVTWKKSPNYWSGRTQPIKSIVIHWWDLPSKNLKIDDVVRRFQDTSSQVSAHYVVSNNEVVQMVKDSDTAWHARDANPFTIGIEVDPNTPGATYTTVGTLVKALRNKHGNLPLERHSKYVATMCPGTIDLKKIDEIANGKDDDMTLTYNEYDKPKQVYRGDLMAIFTVDTWADIPKYYHDNEERYLKWVREKFVLHVSSGQTKKLDKAVFELSESLKTVRDQANTIGELSQENEELEGKLEQCEKEKPTIPPDTMTPWEHLVAFVKGLISAVTGGKE